MHRKPLSTYPLITNYVILKLQSKAMRDQILKAFPAIASLVDKSDGGKVTIEIGGTYEQGYDPSWFRNAVEEPLDEADVEIDER